ncbi:MAG: OmpA family protein [Desulfobacteraceae bacterium]|nr:OmpA family protein [Desulfobacteraceae bacterium]
MKSLWLDKKNIALVFFILFLLVPSMIWSAGYQEEKLFDSTFYSSEDLRKRVEKHTIEIKVIDDQIKALQTDIDWVVLKINQIQDSGRLAPTNLKEIIPRQEKKIKTLRKSKNRLEYLVQYYSAMLDSNKEQTLEDILEKKLPGLKLKKETAVQKEVKIKVEDFTPAAPATQTQIVSSPAKKDLDMYDGISKSELQTAVNQSGLSDWVEIVGTGTCLRLETTLPILFPTGSAKVAKEYKTFFQKLAGFLKPYDVKVFVNGYADTVPIQNKKYPSNFELGATRAANIVHQLVGYGLKPAIFRIESTGKYRFAAKEISKQKSLERRAEVTVIFSG